MGVLISVDENVAWPLPAQLSGTPVEVLGLDESASSPRRGIVARIRRRQIRRCVIRGEGSCNRKFVCVGRYFVIFDHPSDSV